MQLFFLKQKSEIDRTGLMRSMVEISVGKCTAFTCICLSLQLPYDLTALTVSVKISIVIAEFPVLVYIPGVQYALKRSFF